MKAIQYTAYGASDVIELADMPTPTITQDDQVLVRLKVTAVNPMDMKIRAGYLKNAYPIALPFIPGLEAAGIVEAVGANVANFKVGDEVVASSMAGTYAEFLLVKEENVLLKPANLSFDEAVALVVSVGTAQSLLNAANLEAGQKLFIYGAAGAVGAILVQLAKSRGIHVIGTAKGEGLQLLKSLGTDQVIDYATEDFTALVKDADVAVDCVGGPTQAKVFEVVKKGGKLLSIAMPPSAELAQQFGVEARFLSSNLSGKNLEAGFAMASAGKLKTKIAKTFPLAEAAQAQDYLSAGGVNGKVVLQVS